jgi:hypothetical protein
MILLVLCPIFLARLEACALCGIPENWQVAVTHSLYYFRPSLGPALSVRVPSVGVAVKGGSELFTGAH